MPAVKFSARLDLDQICEGTIGARPFQDGHYLSEQVMVVILGGKESPGREAFLLSRRFEPWVGASRRRLSSLGRSRSF